MVRVLNSFGEGDLEVTEAHNPCILLSVMHLWNGTKQPYTDGQKVLILYSATVRLLLGTASSFEYRILAN